MALCPLTVEETLGPKCTTIQKDAWGLFIIPCSRCGNAECSSQACLLWAGHCKHVLETWLPFSMFFNLLSVIYQG